MALSDTKLRALKPSAKPFPVADAGGLFIEVMPGGTKAWRLRYRIGGKQEKVTLGSYPAWSLAEAREWRDAAKGLVQRGLSPMALTRGDPTPPDVSAVAREYADEFVVRWCAQATASKRAARAEQDAKDKVESFAWRWFGEVVEPTNRNSYTIHRVLEKDVLPAIGEKHIADVSVDDVLQITDAIKARGADQMALQTRNIIKRMFAYAMARQKVRFNPAAAVEAKFIATPRSRDVALSTAELGRLLRAIYISNMRRSHKLALHLLILCMVRKSELIHARWEELDLDAALWTIPAERMKKERAHVVPLSTQAVAMFEELRTLSTGSDWVMPSRQSLKKPISKSTLNVAVRTLDVDTRDFVIHDFRRTASTHLNEAGFNADWIEKSLAHEGIGVRSVYNKAQWLDQRREMLQWWADLVDAQIEDGKKVVIGRFGVVS